MVASRKGEVISNNVFYILMIILIIVGALILLGIVVSGIYASGSILDKFSGVK